MIRIWKVQGPNINTTAILTKTLGGLSHSLHKKMWILGLPKAKPRPLPSTFFTTHYSLKTLTLDTIKPELQAA